MSTTTPLHSNDPIGQGTFATWGSRWESFLSAPSNICFCGVALLTGAAGTERLFAGTCRVLPVLADWYLSTGRFRFVTLFRTFRRLVAAMFPVYIPAAALDGAYWTCISLTLPFHPILSPPVARAMACSLGGELMVDGSLSNLLLGLGALVGVLRLFYAAAVCSERFGTHLLMGANLLPLGIIQIIFVLILLLIGFAAALAPTFTTASAAAAAADGLVQGTREWHTLDGSIVGLGLLLYGKFDFDEIVVSAFPATTFVLYTAFCFALLVHCSS